MQQRVVVIGLGIFGFNIVRELHAGGFEVIAVDKNKEAVQSVRDCSTKAIQADGTDKEIMEAIREHGAKVVEVKARGEGVLARIFSMIMLGDWTSCGLAKLYKVDPMSVEVIDRIKKANL